MQLFQFHRSTQRLAPASKLGSCFEELSIEYVKLEATSSLIPDHRQVESKLKWYQDILTTLADVIWEQPVEDFSAITATLVPVVFYSWHASHLSVVTL